MMEAFCRNIWNLARVGGTRFFRRVLAICMISMLLLSFVFYVLFTGALELEFLEHWIALLVFLLIGLASGALFAFVFRRLVSRSMLRGLAKFEHSAGMRNSVVQQMEASVSAMDYRALEDKVMRALGEQREEHLASEREYLEAQGRYPWYTAPVVLDRILADENAAAVRGRSRESVLVLLSLPGASALFTDAEKAGVFERKVLARALAFARSSGMLLAQFSVETCVLVADIPYAASKSLRKRLPVLCRKWRAQLLEILADNGKGKKRAKIVPSCLLHYGEIAYGRMRSGERSAFVVDPQSWQGAVAAVKQRAGQGILISRQYGEYANIDLGNARAAERVTDEWYVLT